MKKRSLEDLAMLFVKRHNPTAYNNKVLPIYKKVKEEVLDYFQIRGKGHGYGTNYKSDFGIESSEAVDLANNLADIFGPEISDDKLPGMHRIYDTVLFFLEELEGKEIPKLADEVLEKVNNIAKEVMEIVAQCCRGEVLYDGYGFNQVIGLRVGGKEYTIDKSFSDIEGGFDSDKYISLLSKNLVKNKDHATRLADLSPFYTITYLATRKIKLEKN